MSELAPPDPPLSRGRVLVRPPKNGDVEVITAACQDPDIARFTRVPNPYTEDDAAAFVELSRAGWEDGSTANFVGIDLHNGMLLGSCGLRLDPREDAAELGYWVVPEARGAGVATTMAWIVANYGLTTLGLQRLNLITSANNEASRRVARHLGFQLEGTMRSAHIDGHTGDRKAPRVDAEIWGLLPGELRDPEEDRADHSEDSDE